MAEETSREEREDEKKTGISSPLCKEERKEEKDTSILLERGGQKD